MLTRKQKQALIEELSEELKQSKSAVLCNFKGLNVAQMSELRKNLRKAEAKAKITKKTLVQLALKKAGVELAAKELEGQVMIAWSKDEVSAAKEVYNFGKKNEELQILAGVLEKDPLEKEAVLALAKTPSREELLAKLTGSLKSPISGLANVLSGNLRNLVYALNAIRESKEGSSN